MKAIHIPVVLSISQTHSHLLMCPSSQSYEMDTILFPQSVSEYTEYREVMTSDSCVQSQTCI